MQYNNKEKLYFSFVMYDVIPLRQKTSNKTFFLKKPKTINHDVLTLWHFISPQNIRRNINHCHMQPKLTARTRPKLNRSVWISDEKIFKGIPIPCNPSQHIDYSKLNQRDIALDIKTRTEMIHNNNIGHRKE